MKSKSTKDQAPAGIAVSDPVLKYFQEHLLERLGDSVREIILFGSRARGDFRPGSDYDCLILVDRVTPEVKEAIFDAAGEVLFEFSVPISAFPVETSRFRGRVFNPFLLNVRREGVSLWPAT